jgi:hypothetical protein
MSKILLTTQSWIERPAAHRIPHQDGKFPFFGIAGCGCQDLLIMTKFQGSYLACLPNQNGPKLVICR